MKKKEETFRKGLQYYEPNDLDLECTYSSAGMSGPLFPLLSPEDVHFDEIFERYRPIMKIGRAHV